MMIRTMGRRQVLLTILSLCAFVQTVPSCGKSICKSARSVRSRSRAIAIA